MAANFKDRIETYTTRVNDCLEQALPTPTTAPQRLHQAMRYAVLNGGKRIRPLLVYAAGECLGTEPRLLDGPAVAIELIHAFSLVHDDLPSMDNDDLRRGKPTVHIQFDEATAILAADALQPLAFSVLADLHNAPPQAIVELLRLIATACGSTGMTGGQSIDLAAEGKVLSADELQYMYSLKTGALIHASVLSAFFLSPTATNEDFAALDSFGQDIGIAFQIWDDILDIEGATDVIGKPAGSDVLQQKATYPALFGVDAAKRRCGDLLTRALKSLSRFGNSGESLEWLARYMIERGQ